MPRKRQRQEILATLRQADEAIDECMNMPAINVTLDDDLTPKSVRAEAREVGAARRRARCAGASQR
jgi:hypothetical protein